MKYYKNPIYIEELRRICREPFIHNLKSKKILITGARGLIGSMLIDMIMYANWNLDLDCKIYAVVRNVEVAKDRFQEYMDNLHFNLYVADINVDDICIDGDIDYVIHGASNTHPILYAAKPIETILTNIVGTNKLLDFASKHHCKRFVFLSSVEVYGENRGDIEAFTEDYCGYINSNTLRAGYPEGKRAGEALCQAYRKEKNLDCIILRVARCYGPGLLADDSKALSQFLQKALQHEDIILKSEGNQYFSYVYVADVISAIGTFLCKGEDGEAYNIVGKESNITLKNLASMIAEQAGVKVRFDVPDLREQLGYSKATTAILDMKKSQIIGWSAKKTLNEGIRSTFKICKECAYKEIIC